MGMKVGGSSSEIVAEINVVPFVDIVLVVLIIFMVTAPAIISPSLDINLPKAETGEVKQTQNILLSMALDGSVAINGKNVTEKEFEKNFKAVIEKSKEAKAIIAADKDVAYGRVISLVDSIKKMGVEKFAVTVDTE